jgi:DNA polymerase-3 subunit beta
MFNDSLLVSRLIDETYPNYESVIPAENTKAMRVKRDDLIGSIRRVALYASQTTHQVRFQVDKDSLQISAQDIDFGGEARETIPCVYKAEPLEIGFNSQYLVDILTHLEESEVVMKFSTPTRAGIVPPAEENAQEEVIMLVMPVRLTS